MLGAVSLDNLPHFVTMVIERKIMKIEGIRECKMYSIKELTEIIGCHENTLYNDIKSGKLKALQTKDRAKYRVIGKYLLDYLNGRAK